MNTTKHFFDPASLPDDFDHYKNIHLVDVDNRLNIKDAFLNLFSQESYHIARFVSPAFDEKLKTLLQATSYDIIQLETLYLAPYIDTIRRYSNAKIVMRSHNVEHEIWKRITQNTGLGAKKMYLRLLTKRLEQFELAHLNRYDLMAAITARDSQFFKKLGCRIPSVVTPIGLQMADYKPLPKLNTSKAPTFCFIGSLDWMPNLEGIEWILEQVWSKVLARIPNAEFHIAGRNTPDELKKQASKQVIIHGEVGSATDFINAHDVMLVPLFSGGGMRVKILEGMALGKVVLSTSVGLEGIHAKHQSEVLIADSAEAFAEAIIQCYQSPEHTQEMGSAARAFIQKNYDNHSIAERLLATYSAITGQQAQAVEN